MTEPYCMPVRAAKAAALVFAMLIAGAAVARASAGPDTTGARVTLSWNAPPGQPRATASLLGACGDTAATDTLYLCMVPGQDSPTLYAFEAELRFRPTAPDSLADYWRATQRGGDLRQFVARFAPDSMAGAATPFPVPGIGLQKSDLVPGGARLRMIFAVASTAATPVRAGQTYVLATVLVHRPPPRDAACAQPLCVEWVTGTLAWSLAYEPTVTRGERFVGLHAPVDGVCAAWSGARVKPWSPRPITR